MTTRLALILSLAAAGCIGGISGNGTPGPTGDDGSGSGSDMGSGSGSGSGMQMTPTEFVHQQNTMTCTEAWACMATAPDPNQFALMYGTSVAGCPDALDAYMRVASIAGSITAGRELYVESAAESCLAGMSAPATCDLFWTTGMIEPTTCLEALKGTVNDGETCAVDYDCLNDDSICNQDNNTCVAQ